MCSVWVLFVLFLNFSAEYVFSNLWWLVLLPLCEPCVCELLNPRLEGERLNCLQITKSYLIICLTAGDQAERLKDQQM